MGMGPIVGQTMAALAIRFVILWAVVTKVVEGQQLLTTRQHDNLKPAEIRFDSRAIRWMDFSKPARPAQAPQQNQQQWLQPPMPVTNNNNRRTAQQQWNPHAQNWPGYYDYPHQQQQHPERNAATIQYRPSKPVQVQQSYQQAVTPRDVPIRASSHQWHQEIAQPRGPKEATPIEAPISDARSDEILDEEYDSSELFEEDELELDSTPADDPAVPKTVVEDKVASEKDDDDDSTIDILSAFGITTGLSNLSPRSEESHSDKEIEDDKDPEVSILIPPPPALQPQIRQRYPQLLVPPTPPGKRVIVTEEHPSSNPKAVDNHRVSYGLTAASVYARLQPSLRHRNGTGGLRQRVIPRPYKRRPITVTSTTILPLDKHQEKDEDEEELDDLDSDLITEQSDVENEPTVEETEMDEEEEETQIDKVVKTKESESKADEEIQSEMNEKAPEDIQTATNQTEEAEEAEEVPEEKEEEPAQKSPVAGPSTIENETLKPKNSPAAPAPGPADIKSLLRSAGPLSLSEILQQKGMSLAELLKGGSRVAPVIGITTAAPAASTNKDAQKANSKVEHSTTTTTTTPTSTTKTISTTIRPDVLPSVKPISFRELLAAKNLSLQEIIQPNSTPTTTEKPLVAGPTLKPGVKLPMPFSPGRAKGLAGLVAQPAPTEGPATESNPSSSPSPPSNKPSPKPLSELKPMIFGGAKTVEEASAETTTTSTTTSRTTSRQMVIQSKRPYLAGTNVGEYGTHLGRSFDEDEEDSTRSSSSSNKIGSYGMQRPIATSRLTPAPPRKQRPVLNFNYNALSEEEDEEDVEATTTAPILTHFNEEELNENHPYFDLPVSVRNAIIVSSTIGGFCLAVFLVILVVFRIRQKTRIRLRHPAALLGLGVTDMTASNGSDSSGITTPVSHPASKSGYAKLPRRSSSLWGTLRRSVRQMETVHHYS